MKQNGAMTSEVFSCYLHKCEQAMLLLVIIVLSGAACADDFTIDGILDEELWADADDFADFLVTQPLTLQASTQHTLARLYSDDKGIYIGFSNQQEAADRVNHVTLRDEEIKDDYNEVIIDFDGKGARAYGFKLSRTNSIQDAVWTNETRESVDWDGDWQHATHIGEGMWSSEIFLPWSIVAMDSTQGDIRDIKVYFSRWDQNRNQRVSLPGIDRSQMLFLSHFTPVEVISYEQQSLDYFPYFTANRDSKAHQTQSKVGADIFWKPSSERQMNLSLNPDFGQVESDELVVNFSAVETFFAEKRPFFRENHDLFDLQGPESLRLVHTPRIGAAPDSIDEHTLAIEEDQSAENEEEEAEAIVEAFEEEMQDTASPTSKESESSDIDAALRYTHIGESFAVGLLGASEDDTRKIKGRDFAAARLVFNTDTLSLGTLHTYTNRAQLHRKANVSVIDFVAEIGDRLQWSGQWIYSDVEQRRLGAQRESSWWSSLEYQPVDVWSHAMTLIRYGKDMDVSDFGFVERSNRQQFEYGTQYEWPDIDRLGIRDVVLEYGLEVRDNEYDDDLPSETDLTLVFNMQNSQEWELEAEYQEAGIDDLITRGHYRVDLPARYLTKLSYKTDQGKRLQFDLSAARGKDGLSGAWTTFEFVPSYQLMDTVFFELEIIYTQRDSWFIWLDDEDNPNALGEFEQSETEVAFNVAARFAQKHELRLKVEAVAIEAKGLRNYAATTNGSLALLKDEAESFSESEFAAQIRYRYELSALSEIFVVYSRGGEYEIENTQRSVSHLFNRPINRAQDENILFKIKFHF